MALRSFLVLASVGALVGCFLLFKSLLQLPEPPEFAAGLVGGAIWALFTGGAYRMVKWSIEDLKDEIRRRRSRT